MNLTRDQVWALHQCAEPMEGKTIMAFTGLDPRELERAGVLRKVGRWDTTYWKGENFPDLPEPETDEEKADRIEGKLMDYGHEQRAADTRE